MTDFDSRMKCPFEAHLAYRTLAASSNIRRDEDARIQTREIIAMLEAAP